jgi:acyl-CoA-binding protein
MNESNAAFEQAVADSKALPQAPGPMTLLRLYALYKQATGGDVDGERPGFTDPVARAKWDAREQLKGQDRGAAMQDYIELVESLKP